MKKMKFISEQTMKAQRRVRGTTTLSLTSALDGVKVKVSHNRPRWPKGFRVS
jgi:hypothetical protein